MHVATIVPTAYLDLVRDRPYHLCLVQQLQADPVYRWFYKRRADEGKFIIVDNGAAEKHVSTIEEVYDMAMAIGASEIQLPDVFFDGKKTLKKSYEAMGYLHKNNFMGEVRIMVVPQGRNLEEWTECMKEFIGWGSIDCIGIPKNLVHTEGPKGRLNALTVMRDYLLGTVGPSVRAHLLGCWTDPREVGDIFRVFGNSGLVRGVDSGICTIYAQEGLPLKPDKYPKPRKIVDFSRTDIDTYLLDDNMFRWEVYAYGILR